MTGIRCPLCRSDNTKESFQKTLIRYYRCRSCRFLFSAQNQNPNLELETVEQYEPAYVSYLEDSPEDTINFRKLLEWIEQFKSLKGLRVLDVGTGTGKLVRYLRNRSVDAFGLEPSAALYKRYLSKEPFFFFADLKGLTAVSPAVQYDAVIIADVLEHIPDPQAFFSDLRLILKPGAVVYVCTPNADSFLARICGKHWHYINKYHFSFFSHRTITDISAQHGLKEIGYAHFTRFKAVGYILQYFMDFVAGSTKLRVPKKLYQWGIPFNLHDLMQIIYRYD